MTSSMANSIRFDNSYQQLPERFYTRLAPTPVSKPGPIRINQALAGQLGISADWLSSPEGTECTSSKNLGQQGA